jgi:hypothetical protein
VNYHIVYGLSLDIQDIDTNFTIGVLEQQRQATLASLVENNPEVIAKVGERYVTRNAKLPLPIIIQRIAVVSSKTSAGNINNIISISYLTTISFESFTLFRGYIIFLKRLCVKNKHISLYKCLNYEESSTLFINIFFGNIFIK